MRNKDIIELKKFLKSKQISTAGNYNEVKNKVKNYFNKQVEINKKVNDETQKLIRDLSGRNRVKKDRNIDISNLFINNKKTREVPDIPEYIFKIEEEHNNNPSIQWIRENSLTVNISMNANGAEFGTLFDTVVRDLKNRMNERDSYKVQFTTRLIFYSQKDNEELEPIHYHSYS